MPGRSPGAASASRSSSATRRRSWTTTTGSSSTTPWSGISNPADAPQLAPAVGRVIKRTARPPRTVAADRGYGEKAVEDHLHDLGVRQVVIPQRQAPQGPP